MVELGAGNFPRAIAAGVDGRSGEHPEWRGDEVEPQSGPFLRCERAGEASRRIEAHPGSGRFEGNEERDAGARAEAGEAGEPRVIRHVENHGHE